MTIFEVIVLYIRIEMLPCWGLSTAPGITQAVAAADKPEGDPRRGDCELSAAKETRLKEILSLLGILEQGWVWLFFLTCFCFFYWLALALACDTTAPCGFG